MQIRLDSGSKHRTTDGWKVVSMSPSFGKFDVAPVQLLQAHGIEVVLLDHKRVSPERLVKVLRDCRVVIAGTAPVTEAMMLMAPQLRMIAKHGVGVENIDVAAASRLDVYVTNVPGAGSSAVAELVFGHILAVTRGLVRVDRQVRLGKWPTEIGMGLYGSTLGIIGTGRIGQAVGAIARGFGMRILAHDPFPSDGFAASGANYDSVREVLRNSDVVTLHVPLSSETHHLISRNELRLMKQSAFLINASRGSVVDEEALVDSLVAGEIAGAGLDVHDSEPTMNHRLLELENVTVTSHIGAYTYGSLAQVSADTSKNILRLTAGIVPDFIVNELA